MFIVEFEKIVKDAKGEVLPFDAWKNDAGLFYFDLYEGENELITGKQLETDENGNFISNKVVFEVDHDGSFRVVERLVGTNKKFYEKPGDGKVAQEIFLNPSAERRTISIISKQDLTYKGKEVYEVDPGKTWSMPDETIPIREHWKNALVSDPAYADLIQYGSTWIWDRPDSWLYGSTGSQIIHYTMNFNLTQEDIDNIVPRDDMSQPYAYAVPIWFAADNAAVLYVNGERVAYTERALAGREVPEYKEGFTNLTFDGFDGKLWDKVYYADLLKFLREGPNELVFYAANSINVEGDANNGDYDITNNPCGLIFASVITIEDRKEADNEYVNVQKPKYAHDGKPYNDSITATNYPEEYKNKSWGNWFTFVDLRVLDLAAGATIDMVNGNKLTKVGEATVKLVDGRLEIKVCGDVYVNKDGEVKSEIGARLYSSIKGIKNLNEGGHINADFVSIAYNDEPYLFIHAQNLLFYVWD